MTKTFDEVLTDFEKKTGLTVGRPETVTGLPTGNIGIDWLTGVGGLPRGRISELYGYESSGKTTCALQTAVALQQDIMTRDSDERILYVDFEHALDGPYAEQLGIDFNHRSFVPIQPVYLEQGAKVALDLIATGKTRLVVFDSVAAMSPVRHVDGEFDQATVQMLRAKLISALCQTMIGPLYGNNCAGVFINHKMESIDMSGRGLPPKVTTPGGRGLKYYASLRLEFDTGEKVKGNIDDYFAAENNEIIGNKVYVKCIKNKVSGAQNRSVQLRSRYGLGFDNVWSAVQVLVARDVIKKTGAWFNLPANTTLSHPQIPENGSGKAQFHGEQAIVEFAEEHPEWRTELIATAQRALAAEVETL